MRICNSKTGKWAVCLSSIWVEWFSDHLFNFPSALQAKIVNTYPNQKSKNCKYIPYSKKQKSFGFWFFSDKKGPEVKRWLMYWLYAQNPSSWKTLISWLSDWFIGQLDDQYINGNCSGKSHAVNFLMVPWQNNAAGSYHSNAHFSSMRESPQIFRCL